MSNPVPVTQARIGVLMGGHSAERDISLKTGDAIYHALRRRGYAVSAIDVDASLPWTLRQRKVEVAFIALHGPGGEDGTVQGLLDVLDIPYTGSGVRASAVAMDKPMTKALMAGYGIPVPPGVVLHSPQARIDPEWGLAYPLVVKPASQGSTVGVSIVRRQAEWKRALGLAFDHDSAVVVETYIAGREIGVSILDGTVFPTVEIVAPKGFYDYAAKYEKQETRYHCPASLTPKQHERLRMLTSRAYEILGCSGAARVDFRLNQHGRPFLLEVNTIPGMTERSLLPMAAEKAHIDYDTLIERMLQSALKRRKVDRNVQGSHGHPKRRR